MVSKVYSMGLMGIDGFLVEVECDVSIGMPAFDIVGLPDAAVKEAKERVRSAIKNCGYEFPPRRIVVNLAPADVKKEGSVYDLAVCLGILSATGQINVDFGNTIFAGELSLEGSIRKSTGVLPMVISAKQLGYERVFVPKENAREAAAVCGINIYGCETVSQLIEHLSGGVQIEKEHMDVSSLFVNNERQLLDFCDVQGQALAKRALEIAAAGGHNILLIGPPGTGKSMLAKRLPTILPEMTFNEAIETTKIHSVAGVLSNDTPLVTKRPFRSPHHTVSLAGLCGGGRIPRPGEVSLAHNGVLFLDEFAEFSAQTLEVLRQPLEDGKVTISRVNSTIAYPCEVMLVAAMNPCKCGYFGHPAKECTCSQMQRARYMAKVSGPILDRIDIQVEVSSISYSDISRKNKAESSEEILKRVNAARAIQNERYKNTHISCNARLDASMIKQVCALDESAQAVMKQVFDSLGLSARGHDKILKIARTIADLDNSQVILKKHIMEAVQYRSLDKKYWQV